MEKCTVMQNGFQLSIENAHCILFLFRDWNLNTRSKYLFAVLGTFFLAISIEILTFIRRYLIKWRRISKRPIVHQIILSFTYGIHMFLAYCLMLLVMTYDIGIFIAILLGLVVGHFTFGMIQRRISSTNEETPLLDSMTQEQSFSTHCCTESR